MGSSENGEDSVCQRPRVHHGPWAGKYCESGSTRRPSGLHLYSRRAEGSQKCMGKGGVAAFRYKSFFFFFGYNKGEQKRVLRIGV